jgi:hypothetical protein
MKCLILLLVSVVVAENAFNLEEALTVTAFQEHLVSTMGHGLQNLSENLI